MDRSIISTNIGMLSVLLIFMSFLAFMYFTKKNMDNIENKIYKIMIIGALLEIITGLIARIIQINGPVDAPIITLLLRIKEFAFLIFYFYIVVYKIVIMKSRKKDFLEKYNKNKKKVFIVFSVIMIISFLLCLFLPMKLTISKIENIYETDVCPAMLFFGLLFLFLTITYAIVTLLSIGKIEKKKMIPFLVIDICYFVLSFDSIFSNYITATLQRVLVVFIMYHTIENPDMKLVNEMELAKNQAEKSNNAKSDFLSSMSHELRTPLNAIVGLSQMIEEESNQEEVKNDAKDIVVASENLLELVNGILDINKLEANEVERVEKNYNPIQTLNELENMIKIRIGDKPIELRTNYQDNIPNTLYGDKDNIKRIVSNLLTNAVKYTESGYIDFIVESTNTKDKCNLKIVVKDTGRGISEERIPNLFTKFNRLESDKDSDISGTGLGLAITKSLVDLLGGKIQVESKLGEGTTFTVTLTQVIVNEEIL